MDETLAMKILMVAMMTLTAICGLAAVGLIVRNPNFWGIVSGVLMAAGAVGCGFASVYFSGRVTGHSQVFSNAAEREVLTVRQRRELKSARGGLVFNRAMIEIENERDKMLNRQLEAATNPEPEPKPEPVPEKKISAEEPYSITCPDCGHTSYNSNDIREGYCGHCYRYTHGKIQYKRQNSTW